MKKFTELERAELAQLRESVRRIEASAIPWDGDSSMLLSRFLSQAKRRIDELEKLEEQTITEERERASRELSIAAAAQRETALSREEQRQYAEFLEKEHFTKADFGKLESFYKHTWDRLSEDGKAEMSHRVWEGVRREEYKFSELPDIVKEKEASRLRDQLSYKTPAVEIHKIPQLDRSDFVRAWDSGQKQEAYRILERKSFTDNVATTSKTHHAESAGFNASRISKKAAESPAPHEAAKPSDKSAEPELSLDDLNLVDAGGTAISAPLPELKGTGPAKLR